MKVETVFALLIAGTVLFWTVLVLVIILLRKRQKTVSGSRKKNPREPTAGATHSIGIEKEVLERILERVKENTKCECVQIDLRAEPVPSIFESKVGGYPYWDPSKPYPTDSRGEKLALLAQIDLAALPATELLPQHGLLQFFILPGDDYGMNYDCRDRQDAFRVVFHREINRDVTEETVRAMDIPTSFSCGDALPHCGEFSMRFRREQSWMGVSDFRFEEELDRSANELGVRLPEDFSVYSIYKALEKDKDAMSRLAVNEGSHLLGYPWFVQEDPRSFDSPYNTLLFQLDSCFGTKIHPDTDPNHLIMWGDAGVGNFFIREEDLMASRFDRIYYTWDCG